MSQAQPVEVLYPNPTTAQQAPQSSSSHSNGSFGPVFVVLAVIVVISAAACVLGRLCSRRKHGGKASKAAADRHPKANKHQSNGLGPKEWESRQKPSFNMRDGDIEFGFDKKISSAKGGKNGGGGKGKPPHQNGGHRPEVRFADNV